MYTWRTDGHPSEDVWCWVSDGEVMWPALWDMLTGWHNNDTWEDWGPEFLVKFWTIIPVPSKPGITSKV